MSLSRIYPSNSNPYPGPRPFEQADANNFFGREFESRDLLSLIFSNRLVLVYAPSGAGKSSLLKAGLIPLIEKTRADEVEVLPIARVTGILPEPLTLEDVRNIFSYHAISSWVSDIDRSAATFSSLKQYLAERPQALNAEGEPRYRILIFDQLEELFTHYPERWKDRVGFFLEIAQSLQANPYLCVLFVIRQDYVASLDPYVHLLPDRLRYRLRLDRLSPTKAGEAVIGPAAAAGRTFTGEAVAALITSLSRSRSQFRTATAATDSVLEEHIEPVQLQIVCQNLWNRLPADVTTISEGHVQSYARIDESLREYYEAAIHATVQSARIREGRLRKWFEEKLITPDRTRGLVFQGETDTGGIPNKAVSDLEKQHIIRSEPRGASGRWIELTHDRLLDSIITSNAAWRRRHRTNLTWLYAVIGLVAMPLVALSWQELTEYQNTEGQFKTLEAELPHFAAAIDKTKMTEATTDRVAGYLWSQGKVTRLIKTLQKYNRIIHDYYEHEKIEKTYLDSDAPGTATPDRLKPKTGGDASRRFVIRYRRAGVSFDTALLDQQWRSYVSEFGVPLPSAFTFEPDDDLVSNKVELSVDRSADSRLLVSIPSPDHVLVKRSTQIQFNPDTREALDSLIRTYGQRLEISQEETELLLLPRWTLPIWKVASVPVYQREAALARSWGLRWPSPLNF
jgi:hypothetical protein